jgi:hypothetical protein
VIHVNVGVHVNLCVHVCEHVRVHVPVQFKFVEWFQENRQYALMVEDIIFLLN